MKLLHHYDKEYLNVNLELSSSMLKVEDNFINPSETMVNTNFGSSKANWRVNNTQHGNSEAKV